MATSFVSGASHRPDRQSFTPSRPNTDCSDKDELEYIDQVQEAEAALVRQQYRRSLQKAHRALSCAHQSLLRRQRSCLDPPPSFCLVDSVALLTMVLHLQSDNAASNDTISTRIDSKVNHKDRDCINRDKDSLSEATESNGVRVSISNPCRAAERAGAVLLQCLYEISKRPANNENYRRRDAALWRDSQEVFCSYYGQSPMPLELATILIQFQHSFDSHSFSTLSSVPFEHSASLSLHGKSLALRNVVFLLRCCIGHEQQQQQQQSFLQGSSASTHSETTNELWWFLLCKMLPYVVFTDVVKAECFVDTLLSQCQGRTEQGNNSNNNNRHIQDGNDSTVGKDRCDRDDSHQDLFHNLTWNNGEPSFLVVEVLLVKMDALKGLLSTECYYQCREELSNLPTDSSTNRLVNTASEPQSSSQGPRPEQPQQQQPQQQQESSTLLRYQKSIQKLVAFIRNHCVVATNVGQRQYGQVLLAFVLVYWAWRRRKQLGRAGTIVAIPTFLQRMRNVVLSRSRAINGNNVDGLN